MKIIDVVLHSYNLAIRICSIVRVCNLQNKFSTSVISLIKYGKKVCMNKNMISSKIIIIIKLRYNLHDLL